MVAQRWVEKVSGVSVLGLLQNLCLPLALPGFIACPLEPARDPMVGTKAMQTLPALQRPKGSGGGVLPVGGPPVPPHLS